MSGKMCDISGERFGRLVAIRPVGKDKIGAHIWECVCDCGNIHHVNITQLHNHHVTSCGCYQREMASKHNGAGTRLYKVYRSMIERCESKNNAYYEDYGGRGIRVCDEWRSDFDVFRRWAMGNGYDPTAPKGKCTIDRIDVNGNYEPNNCRFVTMAEQAANKRTNVYLEINGEKHHVAEWARISGTKDSTIRMRLARGKTAREAVCGGVCHEIQSCGRCRKA